MSAGHLANHAFLLDGVEPLGSSYDDEADVLYLWRGSAPVEAIYVTTDQGHAVGFEPETGEIVSFTILNWQTRWIDKTPLVIELPDIGASEEADAHGPRHLELVPA